MMGPAADLCLLKRLGRDLNSAPDKSSLTAAINGTLTIQDLLIETLLKVRSKTRGLVLLSPNRAQQEYGRKCGRRNVVLKARQLGITTYQLVAEVVLSLRREPDNNGDAHDR